MWIIGTYTLLAVVAVVALSGAAFIVGVRQGAETAAAQLSEARMRLTELETAFAGFSEQYELSYVRSSAKIGKLRRTLARERGEDDEEDSGQEALPQLPAPTAQQSAEDHKLQLRRQLREVS